jgi:hypothetical protein
VLSGHAEESAELNEPEEMQARPVSHQIRNDERERGVCQYDHAPPSASVHGQTMATGITSQSVHRRCHARSRVPAVPAPITTCQPE